VKDALFALKMRQMLYLILVGMGRYYISNIIIKRNMLYMCDSDL